MSVNEPKIDNIWPGFRLENCRDFRGHDSGAFPILVEEKKWRVWLDESQSFSPCHWNVKIKMKLHMRAPCCKQEKWQRFDVMAPFGCLGHISLNHIYLCEMFPLWTTIVPKSCLFESNYRNVSGWFYLVTHFLGSYFRFGWDGMMLVPTIRISTNGLKEVAQMEAWDLK